MGHCFRSYKWIVYFVFTSLIVSCFSNKESKQKNPTHIENKFSWVIVDTSLYDEEIHDASLLFLLNDDKKYPIHSSFSKHTVPQKEFTETEIQLIKNSDNSFPQIIDKNIISGTRGFYAGLEEGFYLIKTETHYQVYCFYLDEDMEDYKQELVLEIPID